MPTTERVRPSHELLERVRRLLALTTSPNENEAAVAATKAMELVEKYKLDISRLEVETGVKDEEITHEVFEFGPRSKIAYSWMIRLGCVVADAFFCHALFWEAQREFIFIGRPTDIAVAKDTYGYLRDQMLRISLEAAYAPGQYMHRARFRSGWLVGCTNRVSERLLLLKLEREGHQETMALVRASNVENDAYKKETFQKLSTSKYKYDPSMAAKSQGYREGDKVSLQREKRLSGQKSLPEVR